VAHPFPNSFDADRFETRLRELAHRDPFLFPAAEVPDHFRRSSVLIGFWREDSDLRVILTKRAATLSGHPGQMSFPGGTLEPGEDWGAAALRETEEEVGLPRRSIEVLGRLDDAWSGAGHLLVPIVGWLESAPLFAPNPAEVESVHTPSVRHLMSPAAHSEEEIRVRNTSYQNKTLEWEGGCLFGLSTDLFIEAAQWATGIASSHGQVRLASLRSYLANTES
jgi:8-oxo-dGTP pyrophosphatase MutT (NUDIX family)